ncbi:YhbP family protein [Shewanella sp.]|uniref:YhbP family protein n=1 Tax=Shewanella sp. TaxID=50422 RepID=UPI003A97CD76
MADFEQLPPAIVAYLQRQHVLTLATQDADGLWCASCFYFFDATSVSCYLMTSDNSRHTHAMLAQPQIAGTIAEQTRNVAKIQGIQFTAIAKRVAEAEEKTIKDKYCEHFPVARLKSAPLWQLELHTIKMTDNLLGFGKKHHWQRG